MREQVLAGTYKLVELSSVALFCSDHPANMYIDLQFWKRTPLMYLLVSLGAYEIVLSAWLGYGNKIESVSKKFIRRCLESLEVLLYNRCLSLDVKLCVQELE